MNRSGQGLVEQILVVSLVAVALILALLAFRDSVGSGLDGVTGSIESSAGTSTYVPGGGSPPPAVGGTPGSGGTGRGRGRGSGSVGGRGPGSGGN